MSIFNDFIGLLGGSEPSGNDGTSNMHPSMDMPNLQDLFRVTNDTRTTTTYNVANGNGFNPFSESSNSISPTVQIILAASFALVIVFAVVKK